MDLQESSHRYEFATEDAEEIRALFADLKKGVDAFEWMLGTMAGEALTHHFELSYLLRNIKGAIANSAGCLPTAACTLREMHNLLCQGPLLDLTGSVTTAVTFVKLSGEEGHFVRVVLEGLSDAERRLIKFMERPHGASREGTPLPQQRKKTRLKKHAALAEPKPRSSRAKAKEAQSLQSPTIGKAA